MCFRSSVVAQLEARRMSAGITKPRWKVILLMCIAPFLTVSAGKGKAFPETRSAAFRPHHHWKVHGSVGGIILKRPEGRAPGECVPQVAAGETPALPGDSAQRARSHKASDSRLR